MHPPKSQRAAKSAVPLARTFLETGRLPIAQLARLACREGQATNPLFRVHRWFARRLPSQFRAILTGLALPASAEWSHFWDRFYGDLDLGEQVVLDPFVGGGTSATEAVRAGARFIGYDIDPVAAFITSSELTLAKADDFLCEATAATAPIAECMQTFHRTVLPDGTQATVLHHFWVQVRRCATCRHQIELHPHYQLAYDAKKKRQWAFCRACHEVHELALSRRRFACACGTTTTIFEAPLSDGVMTCPTCNEREPLVGAFPESPVWKLFAQEYLADTAGRSRKFKRATRSDRARAAAAGRVLARTEQHDGIFTPSRDIPAEGRKDQRPLIHGITTYRQLFNARQLLHLTRLGREIAAMEDGTQKRLLALAFSDHLATNCMYTAYAFGYRRTSALFSIHGYRHITRPVEINPWLAGIGRGTYPNALRKISRAIEYAKAPSSLARRGGRSTTAARAIHVETLASRPQDVLRGTAGAAVVAASASDLTKLPRESVDIVLTDPPYFDNVAYSELSDFFLAWQQRLGVTSGPYVDPSKCGPLAENLGLPRRDPESTARYRRELATIFAECRRVLKTDGVLAFTYHHDAAVAWEAVAYALRVAGFRCTAVLPLRGEGNGGLHSFAGTIKWDAVFVCRRRQQPRAVRGPLRIHESAIGHARITVAAFRKKLRGDAIGFRPPDADNLFRALLVASASCSTTDRGVYLEEALRAPLGRR